MGIFGKKKKAETSDASVDSDEEMISKMSETVSSLDEKIELSDKKYR